MKWYNKILGAGALALASLTFSPKKAEACSSAIPIGRGATNVAVADGASAVYWNPAGLIQLEGPELDMTVGPDKYIAFLCYGQPLDDKSAVGLNFSYREDEHSELIVGDSREYMAQWLWLKLGYSRKLTDKLSIGANLSIKQMFSDTKTAPQHNGGKPYFNMDFGVLYKPNEKFRAGLLLQGYGVPHLINVRPGVSFKLDDKTLLIVEGYDITNGGAVSTRHTRLGLEKRINDRWSVRGGIMVGKGDQKWIKSGNTRFSGNLGASYRKGDLEISVAGAYNVPYFMLSLNKKF